MDGAESVSGPKAVGNRIRRPTKDVKHETDEAVILGKRQEVCIDEDNVLKEGKNCVSEQYMPLIFLGLKWTHLEIVDDALSIEKVVANNEEVPV